METLPRLVTLGTEKLKSAFRISPKHFFIQLSHLNVTNLSLQKCSKKYQFTCNSVKSVQHSSRKLKKSKLFNFVLSIWKQVEFQFLMSELGNSKLTGFGSEIIMKVKVLPTGNAYKSVYYDHNLCFLFSMFNGISVCVSLVK